MSTFRTLSESDLKTFRAAVRTLKAKGLIPPKKNGKTVKPGSARPGDMYQGKTLRDYVRDKTNQQVIRGEAVVLPKSRVRDTQGYKVVKPKGGLPERVIVPVAKDARVSTERGNIVIRHESETGSVKRISVPRKNLRQYLHDAEQLPDLTPDRNMWYAFYFYGNRSHAIFRSMEHLIEYLTAYDALQDGATKDRQAFRNLEILQITNRNEWLREVEESARRRRQYRGKSRQTKKQRLERMPEYKKQIFRAKNAEYMRQYRARKGKA